MLRYVCLGSVALCLLSVPPTHAAAPSGSVSFDQYNGPESQTTRSVLGLGDVAFGRLDALAGVLRFHDTTVGAGNGFVFGGGAALDGPLTLRVLASRFVGDGDYRAWRVKSGPLWSLPGGGSLGAYWVHDTNNLGPDTESGAGELAVPVAHGWTGKLSGAYGRSEDRDGYVATLGAAWSMIPHLELSGEVGAAKNPPATTPAPSRGLLSPILGGPQKQNEVPAPLAATSSINLRVSFP